jgi:hypothetical protein
MSQPEETRRVVEGYFAAWTSHRVADAYALLAHDLEFWGPTASYQSAEAFLPALTKFAAMTQGARILDLVVEHDRAALLYDCDLVPPIGTVRIASFFRVENGRIRAYQTAFDATELRKAQAASRS